MLLSALFSSLLSLLLLPQMGLDQAKGGAYVITPERRALLNTIRFAEGTWSGGADEGYHLLYGGGRIADLRSHPEIVVKRRYSSAAAGAYQFLPATWREASMHLKLRDFGAASQDQAALFLIERRGVLSSIDRRGLDDQSLFRLAPEWASLPTASGLSHYGQPVKRSEDLLRFYRQQLLALKG